jgi:hypothetical protein
MLHHGPDAVFIVCAILGILVLVEILFGRRDK